MNVIAVVYKAASGITFFVGMVLLLYRGAYLPDTTPLDLFSRLGTSIEVLSDAIILLMGALILFGIGHGFTLMRAIQQKQAVPVPPSSPKKPSHLTPVAPTPHSQRRERFPNEEAFAQYVAFVLSGTGHYTANSNGNHVQLSKEGRIIGLCMCSLLRHDQFVPYNTFERALKMKHEYDLNVFIIATTGMFDVSVQVAARERGIRLLDGDTLKRLESKHKFRDLLAN